MLETKSSKGAQSIAKLENEGKNNVNNLLEKILERNNLNQAYLKVVKKKGAAGVDGMTVEQMLPYLQQNKGELLAKIKSGK
ncbi:MAG: group intron reverse transcriptase/maturase, partial [Firmicutes bacterium]|nr:group intron reverse transcriptase/maturase [Bacillota bacterium]